jgi:hypothetical protein
MSDIDPQDIIIVVRTRIDRRDGRQTPRNIYPLIRQSAVMGYQVFIVDASPPPLGKKIRRTMANLGATVHYQQRPRLGELNGYREAFSRIFSDILTSGHEMYTDEMTPPHGIYICVLKPQQSLVIARIPSLIGLLREQSAGHDHRKYVTEYHRKGRLKRHVSNWSWVGQENSPQVTIFCNCQLLY